MENKSEPCQTEIGVISVPRKLPKQKILFLDIDGVLNGAKDLQIGYEIDPLKVLLIDHVCEQTDTDIVISSAWRCLMPMMSLEYVLRCAGLKHPRILGSTPYINDFRRGMEVKAYLESQTLVSVVKYAIVDDNDGFLDEQRPYFVRTDGTIGVTPKETNRLIEILG